MYRTISAMVGKGSVNHNSRKFKTENVDGERTHLNIDYCNVPIRQVYHKLFDEALERYNAKQTRVDRRIGDYYEKIRTGKQEKPFHELILQIGNRDDTSSETDIGQKAKEALDEYYRGFQQRNPNLYVFSAHIHMDEATPHIHIDFVPFITESKRGLDTRVSLKQALSAQGFKGGTRGCTEWNQWVQSEKEQLARVMQRYGFEWEHKGTHEEHLDVLDYKKQERAKEISELNTQIEEKKLEIEGLKETKKEIEEAHRELKIIEDKLDTDERFILPEPQGLMSAKSYKKRFVDPLIQKLKALIKAAIAKSYEGWESYHRVNRINSRLYNENEELRYENNRLKEENSRLKEENRAYRLIRKVFGHKQMDELVGRAKEAKRNKQRHER